MEAVKMPVIDSEKCDGCGLCVSVCSCGSLELQGGTAVYIKKTCVNDENCDKCTRWCGNCEIVCPRNAISCPFEIVIEE